MLVFEPESCKMILFALFMYNIEKVDVTKKNGPIALFSAMFSCHALNIADNKVEQRWAAIFSAEHCSLSLSPATPQDILGAGYLSHLHEKPPLCHRVCLHIQETWFIAYTAFYVIQNSNSD